jgi:hypothetical protein
MAPNARPLSIVFDDFDTSTVFVDEGRHKEEHGVQLERAQDTRNDDLTELLDSKADTDGLSKVNSENEDWTDVKHSERKKRDRVLDDGVLIGLMKKSDYEGLKRLIINLSILALTAYYIQRLQVLPMIQQGTTPAVNTMLMFAPLYFFFGFQFQCFAFAGQHEFLHRNAFKTKWINDLCLFVTGVVCFELGEHERGTYCYDHKPGCLCLSHDP